MKFLRPLLALAVLLILIVAISLWWNTPSRVDMANYAPADSIVYVEFNNLEDVANAIQHSEVWQSAATITKSKPIPQNRLMRAAARAGIGPLPAVLFARAQVALVVVGLNTTEETDTLKVRPEVAIIAETHTSKWRTKPAAIEAVKQLANFAYGASMCAERNADAPVVAHGRTIATRRVTRTVTAADPLPGHLPDALGPHPPALRYALNCSGGPGNFTPGSRRSRRDTLASPGSSCSRHLAG